MDAIDLRCTYCQPLGLLQNDQLHSLLQNFTRSMMSDDPRADCSTQRQTGTTQTSSSQRSIQPLQVRPVLCNPWRAPFYLVMYKIKIPVYESHAAKTVNRL